MCVCVCVKFVCVFVCLFWVIVLFVWGFVFAFGCWLVCFFVLSESIAMVLLSAAECRRPIKGPKSFSLPDVSAGQVFARRFWWVGQS